MIMRNARQAIHDAFARFQTTPDRMGIGTGTKFDSDKAAYDAMKSGLIVRSVMEQRTYLRGCALYLNAHTGMVNREELYALKMKLWMDFLKKRPDLDRRAQAEVVAIADELLMGHRARCWDHRSDRYLVSNVAKTVAKSEDALRRVVRNSNIYLDILTQLDNQSLKPVWDVINDQKRKRDEAAQQASAQGS